MRSLYDKTRVRSSVCSLPVDDLVSVAVVDAEQDLPHQDRSVSFRELLALQELVEKFTTFADSTMKILAGEFTFVVPTR